MLFPDEKNDLETRSTTEEPSLTDEDFQMKDASIVLNGKFIDPIEGYKLNEAFNVAEQLRQYIEMVKAPSKRPDYDFSKFDDEDEEEDVVPKKKNKADAQKKASNENNQEGNVDKSDIKSEHSNQESNTEDGEKADEDLNSEINPEQKDDL
jgi:hypothetical protein